MCAISLPVYISLFPNSTNPHSCIHCLDVRLETPLFPSKPSADLLEARDIRLPCWILSVCSAQKKKITHIAFTYTTTTKKKAPSCPPQSLGFCFSQILTQRIKVVTKPLFYFFFTLWLRCSFSMLLPFVSMWLGCWLLIPNLFPEKLWSSTLSSSPRVPEINYWNQSMWHIWPPSHKMYTGSGGELWQSPEA